MCASGISDASYQGAKMRVSGLEQGKNHIGYKVPWWEYCLKTWAVVYSNCLRNVHLNI